MRVTGITIANSAITSRAQIVARIAAEQRHARHPVGDRARAVQPPDRRAAQIVT